MSPCWPSVDGFTGSRRLQNMPEDGSTHVKGKQAKAWNDASGFDHLSAHCHRSRTTDFAVSDLYSSSKQITAASHETSYCISTPAAFPVQSDGDHSQWPQASQRPTVEISVFVSFNPTYWVWLDFFFPPIFNKWKLSNTSIWFSVSTSTRLAKLRVGKVVNGQKFS